jgi:GntR family transcriptional regulator, transcriptional repressor for pyruvate dehydrogenase complex
VAIQPRLRRRPRAFQKIVEEIRDDVFRRRVSPGDRLPNEPDLAERFDVSRLAVREALRVLELQGLVRVEHGFQGGAFVADAGVAPVKDALETMLRLEHLERAEIYAARRYLEPGVAELAAGALDDEAVAKIAANLAESARRLEASKPAFQTNVAFHFLVADACSNRILRLMTSAVLELLRAAEARRPSDEKVNREASGAHAAIFRALREGDGARAASSMEVHLEWLARYYAAHPGAARPRA